MRKAKDFRPVTVIWMPAAKSGAPQCRPYSYWPVLMKRARALIGLIYITLKFNRFLKAPV